LNATPEPKFESESEPKRRPRAFRLDETNSGLDATTNEAPRGPVVIETSYDPYEAEALAAAAASDEAAVEAAQKKGMIGRSTLTWGSLLGASVGALVSIWVGLQIELLLETLFARSTTFGVIALALVTILTIAVIVLVSREIVAVFRQRQVAGLHIGLAQAREADDAKEARRLVHELVSLYTGRPETARARSQIDDLMRGIVDGRDLVDFTERALVIPLDQAVQKEIVGAAKRVSVVTALAPRALIDVAFVAAQAIMLIRRIATIYGGRPGFIGFLRLLRSVATHLAITGGLAAGDSILQQVVGHGIAAKLSARLGEGVLNGLLTARVGLSAMAVCRPMPFASGRAPGISEVAPFLFKTSEPKS
jgi:putative membrane protein